MLLERVNTKSVTRPLMVSLPEYFLTSSKVKTIRIVVANAWLMSGPLNSQCDRSNQHNETDRPAKIIDALK